ncbi:MAG: SpoIIE family protein phosphatase, partial [Actinobacteria bacterium]|nr:SpoIIE family protein phosphatase [Actinomycetota bacterium]
EMNLKEGDTLVMYTDGLLGARHNGIFFGEEGIREFFKKNNALTLMKKIKNLVAEAVLFAKNKLTDDVIIIGIQKT